MALGTTLKRAALVTAIATSTTSAVSASIWYSGSGTASWTVNTTGVAGWNGTGEPNAPGAVADFTGIGGAHAVAQIPDSTTKTVGVIKFAGSTSNHRVEIDEVGTGTLTLNNGGAGATITNSNPAGGSQNRLIISAPLIFGNPNESVVFSNTSGSTVGANGGVAITGPTVSGTTSHLTVESNSMTTSVRFVPSATPGGTFVATNGILYKKGYVATSTNNGGFGGAASNIVTIGEALQGDVFLVSGNAGTVANNITIAGGDGEFRGFSLSTSPTFSGSIVLEGTFSIGTSSAGTNTVNFTTGGISGAGGLNINPVTSFTAFAAGIGNVQLSAANTYSGNTTVNAGKLILNHQLAVQNSTVSTVSNGIVFSNTAGGTALNFTFGGLAGSGDIALQNNAGSPAAIALSVGNNDADTTYSGQLSAGGSLIKIGEGVTTLSNTNGYTGATTISNGVLQIASTGTINSTSGITIDGGELKYNSATGLTQPITFTAGTISGTGAINVPVTVGDGATLSPGNSPGAQPYGSGLTWTGSGDYNWQILDITGSADTGYDVLNITGILDVGAASGFDINLWSLSSIGPDENGDALNWDNTIPHSWTLATTTGGVVDFNAANFNISVGPNNGAAGFSNDLGGGTFSLSVDGNDLVLNFTPIPEPNAFILVSIGMIGLRFFGRRQQRQV